MRLFRCSWNIALSTPVKSPRCGRWPRSSGARPTACASGRASATPRLDDALAVEPAREVARDVGRSVVAEQPGPMNDPGGVASRGREGKLQRVGDVADAHAGAELPGDDLAGEVVEDRRKVEPPPACDLEVGEVGLPELVRRRGLLGEGIGRPDHDEGRAGDQVVRLEQAIDRSL